MALIKCPKSGKEIPEKHPLAFFVAVHCKKALTQPLKLVTELHPNITFSG